MKIRVNWLLVLLLCLSLTNGWTQTSILNIDKEENLSQVLEDLAVHHQILFAYPSELISSVKIKNTEYQYTGVEDLLEQILSAHSLEYYKVDNFKYLIRPAQALTSNDNVIKGQVLDSASGDPLPMACVFVEDYSYGVLTDNEGNYEFSVPDNKNQKVLVSYLGYLSQSFDPEILSRNSVVKLDVDIYELEAPVIEYLVPTIIETRNGGLRIDSKKSSSVSSASGLYGEDILRYIQLLSGVAAHNDNKVDLQIRGSNSESTHIILDGMPLYKVNHYYGIFASVNSQFVEKIELYKNAQPIHYEGRGGGMLILDSQEKGFETNTLDVNLLTSSMTVDQMITPQLNLKVSGRTTYRNVNDSRIIDINPRTNRNFELDANGITSFISSQPDFRFYDLNMSSTYEIPGFEMSLHAFRSSDKLVNNYTIAFDFKDQEFDRQLFNQDENWQNEAFGLNMTKTLGSHFNWKISAYSTNYSFNSALDAELRNESLNNRISNINENALREKGVRSFLSYSDDKHNYSLGASYKYFDINHKLEAEDGQSLIFYDDQKGYLSAFSSYGVKLGDFNVEASLRVPIVEGDRKTRVFYSPQIYGSYSFALFQKLKFSFGRTNQILREIEYETRLGQVLNFFQLSNDKNIPVLTTDNYMLGYSLESGLLGMDIEMFYKSMDGNLMVSTESPGFNSQQGPKPPGANGYRVFNGNRRVYGVDVNFNLRWKNYTSWIAYTWSKNEDQYEQVFKGNYFSSQDDRRHQIKWIHQLELNRWMFNTNIIYSSGRPYLALEAIDDRMPRNQLNNKTVLRQLPNYMRWDVSMAYKLDIANFKSSVGISVFNVLNRRNVNYLQYAYKFESQQPGTIKNLVLGTESELLGRSLNLELAIEF